MTAKSFPPRLGKSVYSGSDPRQAIEEAIQQSIVSKRR